MFAMGEMYRRRQTRTSDRICNDGCHGSTNQDECICTRAFAMGDMGRQTRTSVCVMGDMSRQTRSVLSTYLHINRQTDTACICNG